MRAKMFNILSHVFIFLPEIIYDTFMSLLLFLAGLFSHEEISYRIKKSRNLTRNYFSPQQS